MSTISQSIKNIIIRDLKTFTEGSHYDQEPLVEEWLKYFKDSKISLQDSPQIFGFLEEIIANQGNSENIRKNISLFLNGGDVMEMLIDEMKDQKKMDIMEVDKNTTLKENKEKIENDKNDRNEKKIDIMEVDINTTLKEKKVKKKN